MKGISPHTLLYSSRQAFVCAKNPTNTALPAASIGSTRPEYKPNLPAATHMDMAEIGNEKPPPPPLACIARRRPCVWSDVWRENFPAPPRKSHSDSGGNSIIGRVFARIANVYYYYRAPLERLLNSLKCSKRPYGRNQLICELAESFFSPPFLPSLDPTLSLLSLPSSPLSLWRLLLLLNRYPIIGLGAWAGFVRWLVGWKVYR